MFHLPVSGHAEGSVKWDNTLTSYRFPEDIQLKSPSLTEAWLEIQWKLRDTLNPDIKQDPGFNFALGFFQRSIKEKYPDSIPLDAARMPPDLLPNIVRYQFRNGLDGWPLLQLGPGVASVNFTEPYSWKFFKEEVLFLRENLTVAYENADEGPIECTTVILRYRNSIEINNETEKLQHFLENKLHLSLSLPESIPGNIADSDDPASLQVAMSFKLNEVGIGIVRLATGKKTENDVQRNVIIFDLEIASDREAPPNIYDENSFAEWITIAHRVIHDWYFSLIDGDIRQSLEA